MSQLRIEKIQELMKQEISQIILQELKDKDIECVILKSRSPTCGVKQVYDGTFSGVLREGAGILAEALQKAGYTVLDSEDI